MAKFIPGDRKPGQPLTDEEKDWFYSEVKKGHNPYKVGERLGVSRATSRRLMRVLAGDPKASPKVVAQKLQSSSGVLPIAAGFEGDFGDPVKDVKDLETAIGVQCWREFGTFRSHLFGRRHIAWQIQMAQILMTWWELAQSGKGTDESDIIKGIVNTPPGGGKTTTITHDFPAWLIVRNRDVRISLGARTQSQSERYVRRLRTTLERNVLMNVYFGRFKPLEPEVWRRDQFIVDGVVGHEATMDYKLALAGFDPTDPRTKTRLADPEDSIHEVLEALENVFLTGEKETTVMALSQEMGFLGGRFDISFWDDLCDRNNSRTPEQRTGLKEWWDAEAVSRVEPGGLLGLIGTRFGKYDLFRTCRDLEYTTDDEVEEALLEASHGGMSEEELEEIREDLEKELVDRYGERYGEIVTARRGRLQNTRKVYRYFKFPAHNEEKCDNPHSLRNADHLDCVLDPKRFNYRHLLKEQASDPRRYALTYQQEDESAEDNLVQEAWLTGGVDQQGIQAPGCYNYHRGLLEIPQHLNKDDCFSIATVDPSAQNWWSIEWWIWDSKHDIDYLVDLLRIRLSSGAFLDYKMREDEFDGIMDRWQLTSMEMSWPIGLWILEANAAQKYLFQYRWVSEWQRRRRTHIKGHTTGANKADPALGVEGLSPRYRLGLVDLPYGNPKARVVVSEMAKELKEWPDSETEDTVMGHWFLHANRFTLPDVLKVGHREQRNEHPYADTMPEYVKERAERRGRRQAKSHAEVRELLGKYDSSIRG